jgi:26S proteasome regulatory subunit N13
MPGIGERLRPGMPENWEQSGSEDVSEVVQRPEFQQALGTLSAAISTGQLAPLLQQFGLEGGIDNVEAFLRAVEEQVRREQQGGGSSGDQDNNEDRMQED